MEDADEKAKISSADLGTFQSRLGFHLPAVSCIMTRQFTTEFMPADHTKPNQTQPMKTFNIYH